MASVVGVVLEKLGGMLIEDINKEVSVVCNFRSDFEWLSKKLTNLRDCLRDADVQSAHNASMKRCLLDVAEITWDTEDILDECALQSRDTDNEISQSSCVSAFSFSRLVFHYKMARGIKHVKDRMKSIMEDGKELKLVGDVTHSDQPSTSTVQNLNWKGSPIIESSSHPVAIESKVEQVILPLDDPFVPVIANVALDMELDLNEIVNERIDEVKAAELIHGRSASTRFLIVLDDVWRATEQENLVLSLGFPRGSNPQSKIVVRTQSKNVCSNMNARVSEFQPLSKEESCILFCSFAFHRNQPLNHLQGIARQIEGECERLPLAVKTVAVSLANKTLLREWESKLEQLRVASSTEDPIMQILKLSNDSLPAHLKPCFVYL